MTTDSLLSQEGALVSITEAIHYLLCCISKLKNGTWISYFVYKNVFFSNLSSAQSHVESMDLVPSVNSYPCSRLFLHALNRLFCAVYVQILRYRVQHVIIFELSLHRRLCLAAALLSCAQFFTYRALTDCFLSIHILQFVHGMTKILNRDRKSVV